MAKRVLLFLINTSFLTLSVVVAYLWTQKLELSRYSVQAIGLLIILYFVNYFQRSNQGIYTSVSKLIDSTIVTSVVVLVVLTTGGLQSPAIFLIFIQTLFISLIISPLTGVIIITLTGILLERESTVKGFFTNNYQFYIWLIIPIIIAFISKQYIKLLESQHKIKIIETEKKILDNEVNNVVGDISSFSKYSLAVLSDLINNLNNLLTNKYPGNSSLKNVSEDIQKMQEAIKSLPEKIDEEVGK